MEAKKEAKRLLDWIGDDPLNPDKLHPDLRECYSEDGPMGPMIKHPLINELFFHSWKICNEMYEAKRTRIAEHIAKGEYEYALWFYERPWRMTMFYDWWRDGEITTDRMRQMLPEVWIDAEMPSQFGDIPLILFQTAGFVTDVEDKETATAFVLPKTTATIYRGCTLQTRDGISWTKSAQRAAWFAKRLLPEGVLGEVWTAQVAPEHILGIFLDRNEEEVVVNPANLLNRTRVESGAG